MKGDNRVYTNVVDSLETLSNAYLFAGHVGEAVRTASRGVEALDANQAADQALARLLILYGTMLNHQSFIGQTRFDEATTILARGQTLADQLADPTLQAQVFTQLGMAYDYHKLFTDEGDYETSMDYFQQAMQKFKQANDSVGIGRAFFNIGLIHQRLQHREEAESNFSKALELAQLHDEKLDMSFAYRHRGYFYTLDGNWETARHYAEESLRLKEEIGCRYLISPAHHVLGLVCNDMGEKEAARSHYQTALELAEALDLKLFMMHPLFALSEWHERSGDQNSALSYVRRALDVAQKINYRRSIDAALSKIEDLT